MASILPSGFAVTVDGALWELWYVLFSLCVVCYTVPVPMPAPYQQQKAGLGLWNGTRWEGSVYQVIVFVQSKGADGWDFRACMPLL